MLPVSVAQSFSDDSAKCYVLLVFADDDMFSCNAAIGAQSKTMLFRRVRQAAAAGRSLMSLPA